MKAYLLFLTILLIAVSNSYADSTRVDIFTNNKIHYSGALQNDTNIVKEEDNGRIISRTITLPELKAGVRIMANVDVDSDGDPWDRAASVYLTIPGMGNIELLKYITGFGGHSVLRNDISYLAPLLKGEVTIKGFVDTWVQAGWVLNFSLDFIDSDDVEPSSWSYGVFYNTGLTRDQVDEEKPNFDINIPPLPERVMLTYYVSGHCTDGTDADEFESKDNVIAINDAEILRYKPWRDDCRNFRDRNPMSGRWGDTWSSDLSRSGWCPGDIVYPVVLDVTNELGKGLHNISYWIENIRPVDSGGDYGYWRVSSYLTGWGDVSAWIPSRILIIAPDGESFPPETGLNLRMDLVDEAGYTIFNTDQIVELTADNESAYFSKDGLNWSQTLQLDIKAGTANFWFKCDAEGEIKITAQDADASPTMQKAEVTLLIKSIDPSSGHGYALKFDGVNDYVNCGNNASLQIAGKNITLEARINMSKWRNVHWEGAIISKDNFTPPKGYVLRCGGSGQADFIIGNGATWTELYSGSNAMLLNQWYHLAGTYDGTVMKMYINGELISTKNTTVSIGNSSAKNLFIGNCPEDLNRCPIGLIDEVRVWNITRSQEQLQSKMNDTLGVEYYAAADSGLVGYWRLDEGTGQFTQDLTSFSNNGTLGNSANIDGNDPIWMNLDSLTSVLDQDVTHPSILTISNNYPNPFNGQTTVYMYLTDVSKVHAAVFNSNGELVKHILNGQLPKGEHMLRWNGKNQSGGDVASGVYFLNVRYSDASGSFKYKAIKMVYLR